MDYNSYMHSSVLFRWIMKLLIDFCFCYWKLVNTNINSDSVQYSRSVGPSLDRWLCCVHGAYVHMFMLFVTGVGQAEINSSLRRPVFDSCSLLTKLTCLQWSMPPCCLCWSSRSYGVQNTIATFRRWCHRQLMAVLNSGSWCCSSTASIVQ